MVGQLALNYVHRQSHSFNHESMLFTNFSMSCSFRSLNRREGPPVDFVVGRLEHVRVVDWNW